MVLNLSSPISRGFALFGVKFFDQRCNMRLDNLVARGKLPLASLNALASQRFQVVYYIERRFRAAHGGSMLRGHRQIISNSGRCAVPSLNFDVVATQ